MLTELSKIIHEANVQKGFWDERKQIPAKLKAGEPLTEEEVEFVESAIADQVSLLIISEIAEGVEARRKGRRCKVDLGDAPDDVDQFKAWFEENVKDTLEDEKADAQIRILDDFGGYGVDANSHVRLKLRYNSLRGRKHGKKY